MANETNQSKVKVFLVDDHALLRRQLAALLESEADLEVCGAAGDGAAALSQIRQQRPDLVILDISLKDSHGLELLKALHGSQPRMPVLVLSMHDEARYAQRALQAGARGYITKEEATSDILAAIRRVLGGQVYLSDRMAGQVREKLAGSRRVMRAEVSP